MKWILISLEWLLLAIQYKSPRAYREYQRLQKQRKEAGEPPIEVSWYFKIQKIFWGFMHKYATDYWPKEPVNSYYQVVQSLATKAEDHGIVQFNLSPHTLRLAGATIVIDEAWAINGNGKGIYVHKRETPQSDWQIVYRTDWLMKETGFLKLLDTASRADGLISPSCENVTGNPTISTTIN